MSQLSFKSVFEETDILEVSRLAKQIWSEYYADMLGQRQIDYMLNLYQNPDAIGEQIKKERFSYWILIDENDNNIGYVAMQPKEDYVYISKIYIAKPYRQKGYGKKAINRVAEEAEILGLKEIRLCVHKYNYDSLAAYEKIGFKNMGGVYKDIGGGFVMDDYLMLKKL